MVLNDVDDIKIGTEDVDKIYLGDTVIWERDNEITPPPEGLTNISYVRTRTDAYLNPDFIADGKFKFIIDFETTDQLNSDQNIIGTYMADGSGNYLWFAVYRDESFKVNSWYSQGILQAITPEINTRYNATIEIDASGNMTTTINNNQITGTEYQLTGRQIILFRNGGESVNYCYLKVYSIKMYLNDELKRDFIPVKRSSDGAVGFLDNVSEELFTSDGYLPFLEPD